MASGDVSVSLLGAQLEGRGEIAETVRAKAPERAKSTPLSQLFRCV